MHFRLAFYEPSVLSAAPRWAVRSRWPHLRLVPLLSSPEIQVAQAALPDHVRAVVDRPVDPQAVEAANAVVCEDPQATSARLGAGVALPLVTWEHVQSHYEQWMRTVYLPFERTVAAYDPQGLRPVDARGDDIALEIVGACGAGFMLRYVDQAASQVGVRLRADHVVHSFPVPVERSGAVPDVQIVMPPLRYMHPEGMDRIVDWTDHEARFATACRHMAAYLTSVVAGLPAEQRYVVGFMEPFSDPRGYDFARNGLGNIKVFIRRLNEALAEWCDRQDATWFVDASEVSALVGRMRSDEELVNMYGHRTAFDPYDDWVDGDQLSSEMYRVTESYDMASPLYYMVLMRHILARRLTVLGRDTVKLVITDLDNTLWRGVAAEGTIGSWAGRPMGYVEALRILRQRGILLAIASKNDEAFVRANWESIKSQGEDSLAMKLDIDDDFIAARIGFGPKSESVRQILAATNIRPENAVFIDDNLLEREEVQAAFPALRVLGAELNYVRRELLYSPYTQRAVLTEEDSRRTELTRSRVAFHAAVESGVETTSFLENLGLWIEVGQCEPGSPDATRGFQLINRTNQWNLNGRRLDPGGASRGGDPVLVVARAGDGGGTYGIVGAALVSTDTGCVSSLVVSCRVIGMGVDRAFVSELVRMFGTLTLDFHPTEANRAAAAFVTEFAPGSRVEGLEVPDHIRVGVGVG